MALVFTAAADIAARHGRLVGRFGYTTLRPDSSAHAPAGSNTERATAMAREAARTLRVAGQLAQDCGQAVLEAGVVQARKQVARIVVDLIEREPERAQHALVRDRAEREPVREAERVLRDSLAVD